MSIEAALKFIQEKTLVKCKVNHSLEKDDKTCFWDGISIRRGVVHVNPDIAFIGDFLHDVGHLVTVPVELRKYVNHDFDDVELEGYLFDCQEEYVEKLNAPAECIPFANDAAATFWAGMVCKEIGVDPTTPFQNGYGDSGYWDDLYNEFKRSYMNRFATQAYYCCLIPSKRSRKMRWDISI